MKRPAIVVLLPERYLGALDGFLAGYGRLPIVTPGWNRTPALEAVAAKHRCRVVTLETLLPDGYDPTSEAAAVIDALRPHAAATGAPAALVEERMTQSVPVAVELGDALGAAQRRFELVLLATHEDVTATGRSATTWAASHDVPSLHVAHSLAITDPYTVHAHLAADKLAVFGERGAEGYLDLGIPADRIVVTGNPGWDGYAELRSRRPATRGLLDETYDLDPDLPLVVFATTWSAHLTAFDPGDVHADSLGHFLDACEELARGGAAFNAVVKDRASNERFGRQHFEGALAARGATQRYAYALDHGQELAVAADVLVAVESNFLVEAMLVGTPAVNLTAWATAPMAPAFDGASGVLQVEPDELAGGIRRLLEDDDFRASQVARASERAPYYHVGGADGGSAARVAELMLAMAKPRPVAPPPPARTRLRRLAKRLAQR